MAIITFDPLLNRLEFSQSTVVTGAVIYKGGYNAATNTPDLTTSPASIKAGAMYTVTAAGTLYGETVEIGDSIIAEIDNPTAVGNWTFLQKNTTSGSGAANGKFGITDASGAYTYYDTLELALAAASSGDVVEQFTNITVTGTTTINLPDGVTWQMNGYTYENNDASNVKIFTLLTNVSVIIKNGHIKRTGGTASTVNGCIFNNTTGSVLTSEGVTYESNNSFSYSGKLDLIGGTFKSGNSTYNMLGSGGKVVGVKSIGTGLNNFTNSKIYNCYFYSGGNYNYLSGGNRVYNTVFKSDGWRGCLCAGENELYQVTAISGAGVGLETLNSGSATSYTKLFNCSGFSTTTFGGKLRGYTEAYNCNFYSNVADGVNLLEDVVIKNCVIFTTSGKGVNGTGNFKLINSEIISSYNNAAGHAIIATGTNTAFEVINCCLQTTNASANGINNADASSYGKWGKNSFKGMTTTISSTNANLLINTPDAQGNILIN